uniref:Uncharacterized protein n=1 Tax=Oryza glumipatula TaxID=40148 RepID=A0A0E0B9F4_9ORYZ
MELELTLCQCQTGLQIGRDRSNEQADGRLWPTRIVCDSPSSNVFTRMTMDRIGHRQSKSMLGPRPTHPCLTHVRKVYWAKPRAHAHARWVLINWHYWRNDLCWVTLWRLWTPHTHTAWLSN